MYHVKQLPLLAVLVLACAASPAPEPTPPTDPAPPPIYDRVRAYEHRARTARAVQYLGGSNCQEIAPLFGQQPQVFCTGNPLPYGAFLVYESGHLMILNPETFHAVYRRSQADQEVAP